MSFFRLRAQPMECCLEKMFSAGCKLPTSDGSIKCPALSQSYGLLKTTITELELNLDKLKLYIDIRSGQMQA